jgi:hypothetical protein
VIILPQKEAKTKQYSVLARMSTGRRYVLHFLLSGRGAHVAFGAGQAGAYPYTSPCVAFDAIDGAREERCSSSLLPFLIILFYDDDDVASCISPSIYRPVCSTKRGTI